MWKAIVAGTAALAIAGTSLVYAQRGRLEEGRQRWQPSTEDFRAFGEARLAALKAGLALTADQEKNWPTFEQAARELGKLRSDRRSAMRNAAPTEDPVERLRQRAATLSDTGAALKKLADATDPLYKSLDDSQKRRFAVLNRVVEPIASLAGIAAGTTTGNMVGAAGCVNVSDGTGTIQSSAVVRGAPKGLEIWSTLAGTACNHHIGANAGGRTPSPPTRSPTYGSRRVPTRRLSLFAGPSIGFGASASPWVE